MQTEATLVTPTALGPRPQTGAAEKSQGKRVVGLVVAGVAVIGLAIAAWAYSIGAFGGGDAGDDPVAIDTPVAVTQPLIIRAGDGWEVWVNGNDSGVVTPGSVDLSGVAGDEVTVELRFGELAPISETFTLGEESLGEWVPEDAALAAAAVAAAIDALNVVPPLTFTIASSPAGARVTFDGEVLNGRTPVEVDIDMAARHSVVIELDGYDTASYPFNPDDLTTAQLESRRLDFPLTSAVPPGFVSIDNPSYPVAVTVTPVGGGSPRSFNSSSTNQIRLAPGVYSVDASAPQVHWAGERRRVTVESDRTIAINFPRLVTVGISALPANCELSIDGEVVGALPRPRLPITVGAHTFKFDWSVSSQSSKEVTIMVRSNDQRIVQQAGGKP